MRDTQAEEQHRGRSIRGKSLVDTRKKGGFAVIELEFATRLANRALAGQIDTEEQVVLPAGIVRAANLEQSAQRPREDLDPRQCVFRDLDSSREVWKRLKMKDAAFTQPPNGGDALVRRHVARGE
jgi:hypothetical protein